MADDTLSPAAPTVSTAAACSLSSVPENRATMERKVNIFLQYWALGCFRADHVVKDHGVAPEAGDAGLRAMQDHGKTHWIELFRQAKDLGDIRIYACADSMEMPSTQTDSLCQLPTCGAAFTVTNVRRRSHRAIA